MCTLLIINRKCEADPCRWRRVGGIKTCWAAFIEWMRHTCLGKCRCHTISRPQRRVSITHPQEKGTMLKKILHVFLLSIFFSLAVFVFLLSYSSTSTSSLRPSRKDGFLDVLHQQANKFWRDETEEHVTRGSVTPQLTTPQTTLGSCPETSPDLVGPLRVEFDFSLTWHDVRKKLSHSLQMGGRYQPPDCISNHKVRNSHKSAKSQKNLLW